GLTKGQYSPTSLLGKRSPSSPMGSVDTPVMPAAFALGSGARFVARGVDTDAKNLIAALRRAHDFPGTGFVEVFQNCPVFNDGAFEHFTAKDVAAQQQIHLEHGKPMRFGDNKGLRLRPGSLEIEVVTVGEGGVTEADLLVHDETNRAQAFLLASLEPPAFPVAVGVLYANADGSLPFEQGMHEQNRQARARGLGDLNALMRK